MDKSQSTNKEPSDDELKKIKAKLKQGALAPADLLVLQGLIERTEKAAKQLRAAIVE
jgi:hypothetical protein